ncbi:hypothetical protein [Amycolatopsis magusensis]|uniref:hypothetical protein n=1 Tax=Amycolatopsis magusensis TaxID=882444 RepID=UPI003C2B1C9D
MDAPSRPPDGQKPPVAPKPPDPVARGDRPEGPQKLSPADVAALQRRTEPAGKPGEQGRLATDWKVWRAELKTVVETKDYRPPQGGPVDVNRLKADFGKEVKQQADQRKGSGGVLFDVRLRNVGTGKDSEAVKIQTALKGVGRDAGVLVRVRVEDANGRLRAPEAPADRPMPPRPPLPLPPPQPPHRRSPNPPHR